MNSAQSAHYTLKRIQYLPVSLRFKFNPLQAKKSYGQHFLKNDSIADRIADSLQLATDLGLVLEVGPGRGMLTKFLLEKTGFTLYAVEADKDMVKSLEESLPALEDRLVEADFLSIDLKELMENKPFSLIGNFPYNISTQILFKMLEYRDLIPEMVGMFQKEVADRIVAPPGSKTYGITSVLMQTFYTCQYLFTVERGSFHPPPKVMSAVIRLERKKDFEPDCDVELFKKIVKAAFNQRRKMLRNTLRPFIAPEKLQEDPKYSRRPESLGWEEFVEITQTVQNA